MEHPSQVLVSHCATLAPKCSISFGRVGHQVSFSFISSSPSPSRFFFLLARSSHIPPVFATPCQFFFSTFGVGWCAVTLVDQQHLFFFFFYSFSSAWASSKFEAKSHMGIPLQTEFSFAWSKLRITNKSQSFFFSPLPSPSFIVWHQNLKRWPGHGFIHLYQEMRCIWVRRARSVRFLLQRLFPSSLKPISASLSLLGIREFQDCSAPVQIIAVVQKRREKLLLE